MHRIRQNERYGGLTQGVELLLILYARLGYASFELPEKQHVFVEFSTARR